ncbi:MAG: hypothetical protein Q9N02_05190, partial [Ghiorsea sp.]|nr:hypothetical protein [Ghiorsea sp.]
VPYVAVLLSHTKSAQMFYDFLGSELLTLLDLRDTSATEVALPSGSEAQGERRSLRKHPGVLASLSQRAVGATEVALPSGDEVLTSHNERFYGIYE